MLKIPVLLLIKLKVLCHAQAGRRITHFKKGIMNNSDQVHRNEQSERTLNRVALLIWGWFTLFILGVFVTYWQYYHYTVGARLRGVSPLPSYWMDDFFTGSGMLIFFVTALDFLIFTVALMKQRKWGYWGFCAAALVLYLSKGALDLDRSQVVMPYFCLILISALLFLGGKKRLWRQLK